MKFCTLLKVVVIRILIHPFHENVYFTHTISFPRNLANKTVTLILFCSCFFNFLFLNSFYFTILWWNFVELMWCAYIVHTRCLCTKCNPYAVAYGTENDWPKINLDRYKMWKLTQEIWFCWAKKQENHNILPVNWSKYYTTISVFFPGKGLSTFQLAMYVIYTFNLMLGLIVNPV